MRARIRFSKLGKVRFTSHRDLARVWERALRRGQLPVAYTEGFSPRPRLHFGLALSTGHESLGEYLDVDLDGDVDPDELLARIDGCLPAGIAAQAAAVLAPGSPSLQQDVTSCTWELVLEGIAAAEATAAAAEALAAGRIDATRTRKGVESTDDVRPAILALEAAGPTEAGVLVRAELAAQGRSLRPAELVAACFRGAEERRVVRTHQWIERDGARREPLPLPDDARRALEACA